VRGILSWGVHLPYRRLDRTTIAAVAGGGGGKGTRAVASYDEDSTTMAVEAARLALRDSSMAPRSVWFSTTTPTYLDKTNGVHNLWRQPIDGSAPVQITNFDSDLIMHYGWLSADELILSRGGRRRDIVLIRNFNSVRPST